MSIRASICSLRTTEIVITRPTRFSAFPASKTSPGNTKETEAKAISDDSEMSMFVSEGVC